MHGWKSLERIDVGRWPRYLALSPDGTRLAVGVNGDGGVAVVDTAARKLLYLEDFAGLNLGQMQVSADGKYVYFPWMVYRHNPITREQHPPGLGAGQPHRPRPARRHRPAARPSRSTRRARPSPTRTAWPSAPTSSGWSAPPPARTSCWSTLPGLPFQDYGGPGDHIDPELLKDRERFYRIPLGGRPMAVRIARDGQRVYVANYLLNAVQVVDLAEREGRRGRSRWAARREPSLARKGEAIFYDGRRSARPVVQLPQLPLRGPHQRRGDGHAQRRPLRHLQDGAQPAQRHADRPLDLARLAEGPARRHAQVDDRDDARPGADGTTTSRR